MSHFKPDNKPCSHMISYVERLPSDDNIFLECDDPYCGIVIGCRICDFNMYLADARHGGR